MKQPEGFVEEGLEDHVCKLVHMLTTGTKRSPKHTTNLGTLPLERTPVLGTNGKVTVTLLRTHTHRQRIWRFNYGRGERKEASRDGKRMGD